MNMTRGLRFPAVLPLACLGLLLLAGCHSSAPTISITVSPSTSVSVDELQPIAFTVNVGNDLNNLGVTWTLDTNASCTYTYAAPDTGTKLGDCGSLTAVTATSVTYTAPQISTTASLSVTLTVTAKANSSITQSVTITVVLPPTFTITPLPGNQPTVLPNGSNGIPYSQTIAATGGVAPLTFTISNGSLPTGLQLNAKTGAIVGTPSGPTPAQPNPVIFTIQLGDSGTPPVTTTEPFEISINPAPVLAIQATSPLASGFLNATYNNAISTTGGVTPLTWVLIANTGALPAGALAGLPPGLSLNPNNGQVTGVPKPDAAATYPQQYVFTAQVTDSALPKSQLQTRQFSLSIQKPSVLQITPGTLPAGTAATPYTPITVGATGGIQPYTWSLIGGQLPPGMSLGANGVLSGTPVLATPSPDQFTVQVQDSEVVPQTTSQSLSISVNAGAGNGNILLSGQYTFLFRGFDNNGLAAMVGTITADGNGNITTGQEDINRNSSSGPTVVNNAPISGTYSVGTDGRGTMEFIVTNPTSGVTLTVDYRIVIDSNGNVRFFEDNTNAATQTNPDTLNTHGQGILKPVPGSNSGSFSGFTGSNLSGNYAFIFSGLDSSGKPEAIGGIVAAGGAAANFTSGTSDYNDAGTYSAQNIVGEFTYSNSSGQADLIFAPPGKSQITLDFTFYFVSPGDLFFIQTYSNLTQTAGMPQLSGEMVLQSTNTSFGQTSLNGSSVVTGQGLGASNASVLAGLLTSTACDGTTHISLSYDENIGGAITSPSPSFTSGTCAVASNGRVTFSGFGASAAQTRVAVAYLTGSGQDLVFGSDTAVTTGLLEPQTATLPAGSSSVLDGYTLGAAIPVENKVANIVGQLFAPGGGSLIGTIDENSPPSTTTEDTHSVHADQSLVPTINSIAASGRGTLTANPLVGFPVNLAFYVVTPGSIRMISLDAGGAHPVVLTLDH